MMDRTANLLGVVGLAIADRVAEGAREILRHAGATPAALVVIGYGAYCALETPIEPETAGEGLRRAMARACGAEEGRRQRGSGRIQRDRYVQARR